MDERWAKIERIFNRVLEADGSRRIAVLEESCSGDESLRREVESLLAHHQNAGGFIETPALKIRFDPWLREAWLHPGPCQAIPA